jgi:nucleotide-binding universal stress UspA family protein
MQRSTRVTHTANYVVAYEATEQGRDSIELGIALARLTAAELRICLVLPESTAIPAKVPSATADFDRLLEDQGLAWLDAALALVPDDVVATTHILWAESTSEGLIEAAAIFTSDRIVVGASRTGILKRYTIGSVANALLHASPVPVALAPHGYRAPVGITRITCAIGMRPGWDALLDSMVAISEDLSVELRFITLVEVDAARGDRSEASDAHLRGVLTYFAARSKSSGSVTTEVAEGGSVEGAVEALEWRDDEIALVGSSRLAQPSRIFLGVTANRMLHSLPVPLIVVPTHA